MKIIGAALGEDVHIQGLYHFLQEAQKQGYETDFLGPAIDVDQIIQTAKKENPDIVAVSYRLTPENGRHLIKELKTKAKESGINTRFVFGGTEPVADIARESDFFNFIADGNNNEEIPYFLRGGGEKEGFEKPPQNVLERINWKNPTPLLRTHYGQPTLEATAEGIRQIAESGLMDVISLGTDQDAQSNFFHPERQDPKRAGAGGVPVRSPEDFKKLFSATRTGNFPLMRSYAGTDDLTEMATMYEKTFGNAWPAIPIFWFNDMDGRGPQDLGKSVSEHLKLIEWYAERDFPVEILESHHWGMRGAHDSLAVATAYLGAEITKELGANNYIHQYMFNVPGETSSTNDLAKMLAVKELITDLESSAFQIHTQTRAGLPSFPNNLEEARAQLANSTLLQMQLDPDIIHVVNYSEPHHAATGQDVIDSAHIALHAIKNSYGMPSLATNPEVVRRKEELKQDARYLIDQIKAGGDLTNPAYLTSLVSKGILDAPMLKGNQYARGELEVIEKDGAYFPARDGRIINERERLETIK